jgi:hypothetical protein
MMKATLAFLLAVALTTFIADSPVIAQHRDGVDKGTREAKEAAPKEAPQKEAPEKEAKEPPASINRDSDRQIKEMERQERERSQPEPKPSPSNSRGPAGRERG